MNQKINLNKYHFQLKAIINETQFNNFKISQSFYRIFYRKNIIQWKKKII